VPLRYNDLR